MATTIAWPDSWDVGPPTGTRFCSDPNYFGNECHKIIEDSGEPGNPLIPGQDWYTTLGDTSKKGKNDSALWVAMAGLLILYLIKSK